MDMAAVVIFAIAIIVVLIIALREFGTRRRKE
jgi:hypothetical protein